MLQNGKPVQSIWLGGERFDKYSEDDAAALAKYEKMQAFIGTKAHVSGEDDITDINIKLEDKIDRILPHHDGDVSVIEIIWDGKSSVDLIGLVSVDYVYNDANYNEVLKTSTDLCIIGHKSI